MALVREPKDGAWTYQLFNDLFADPAVCELLGGRLGKPRFEIVGLAVTRRSCRAGLGTALVYVGHGSALNPCRHAQLEPAARWAAAAAVPQLQRQLCPSCIDKRLWAPMMSAHRGVNNCRQAAAARGPQNLLSFAPHSVPLLSNPFGLIP